MSASVQLTTQLAVSDPSRPASEIDLAIADTAATTHDYADSSPINISTSGLPGTNFITLATSVVHVERFFADVPLGADLCFRFGGLPASLLGTISASIAPVGGETIVLAIDGGSPVTTTLLSSDTTIALVARRINYYCSAMVAMVDPVTSRLLLTGLRTGGADAAAKAYSYGLVQVSGGTGLALVGLAVAAVYGSGDDQRVGSGLFAKTFPSSSLPSRVEASGTGTNIKYTIAGRAS